jgi:flavin-dependent dehydrogenase
VVNQEVIVIGGGPAGSTAATMLARKGRTVLLLERERFPRDHIGESLLPASMPILEELGVLPAIQGAGFLKKWGATMVWGTTPEPWSWHFRETNQRFPHAYQVFRPEFDQILLNNSVANGVTARQGCRVLEVLFEGARATGVRFLDEAGAEQTIAARFIVDASGQSGLLGRALRLRRNDTEFRNLAVYGYFEGAERLPPPDDTNIFIESYEHGWFWNIPLHREPAGWMSVGAVVDSKSGQEGIAAQGLEGFFAAQLGLAPNTARMVRDARLVQGPIVIRDWSYVSEEVVGDGYILAGDAACFIDPLFSTGVHLALSAGIMAAAYVTSALKDPEIAAPAGKVYKELYYQQYSHFRELARLFYASNRTVDSYFWEIRRILDDDSLTPRQAFVRATAGQSAKGYERVVLEHGDLPLDFAEGVRMLEAERAARRARVEAAPDIEAYTRVVPVLAQGSKVERKPVIGEGEFLWGYVLSSEDRPEGVPLSGFVATLLSQVDGEKTVQQVLEALTEERSPATTQRVLDNIVRTLRILYVDGAVEELRGL